MRPAAAQVAPRAPRPVARPVSESVLYSRYTPGPRGVTRISRPAAGRAARVGDAASTDVLLAMRGKAWNGSGRTIRGDDEGAVIGQQAGLGGAASAGSTKRTAAATPLCLVPVTIAPELLPTLERFFAELGGVRVVVDHREGDRRRAAERRRMQAAEVPLERRRIRNAAGRRVGERRAPLLLEAAPPLPQEAGEHAQRLRFVRRDEREDRLVDLRASWALVRFQGGERDAV